MIHQCAILIAKGTASAGIAKVGTKVLLRFAQHDVTTESLQETSSVMTEIRLKELGAKMIARELKMAGSA